MKRKHAWLSHTLASPPAVIAAQVLLLLDGVIWLVFSIVSLSRLTEGTGTTPLAVDLLMLGNSGALFWVARGLGRRQKTAWYVAAFLLTGDILLTLTGELGVFDFATLALGTVLLVLLVIARAEWQL